MTLSFGSLLPQSILPSPKHSSFTRPSPNHHRGIRDSHPSPPLPTPYTLPSPRHSSFTHPSPCPSSYTYIHLTITETFQPHTPLPIPSPYTHLVTLSSPRHSSFTQLSPSHHPTYTLPSPRHSSFTYLSPMLPHHHTRTLLSGK